MNAGTRVGRTRRGAETAEMVYGEALYQRKAKERIEDGSGDFAIAHGGTPLRFPPGCIKYRAASSPGPGRRYFAGIPLSADTPTENDWKLL